MKNKKLIIAINNPNPKFRWYNLEKRFIPTRYYLKVDKTGNVILGKKLRK